MIVKFQTSKMHGRKRSKELSNKMHPELLPLIHENQYKAVEFYNQWEKVIPEQFSATACPESTPEQYAAVKLEAGMMPGVKNFKRNLMAGQIVSFGEGCI